MPNTPPPAYEPAQWGTEGSPPTPPALKPSPRKFFMYGDYSVPLWTSWDVASAQGALDSHAQGNFSQSALLAEAMMSDDSYDAVMNTRVLGLTSRRLTFDPSPKALSKKGAVAARDEIKERWDELFPGHIIDGVLSWGLNMGFLVAQIVWRNQEKQWIPEVQPWHPALNYFRVDTRTYIANTMQGPVHVYPGQGDWLLYAPYGEYRGWMRGAVRSCWVPYLARQYALRDWARYSERHGQPLIKAYAPEGAEIDDKLAFQSSIANLGNETTILLPRGIADNKELGYDIELLEAKADTWAGFEGLISKCETRLAIRLLGQNLTTEIDAGSLAAANVHDRVRLDYTRADARSLSTLFREQVLKPYFLYNYGDADLAPIPCWDTKPPEDVAMKARAMGQVAAALVNLRNAGSPIDERKMLIQAGFPVLPEGVKPTPMPAPAAEIKPVTAPGGGGKATSRALLSGHARHATIGQLYADALADNARGMAVSALGPHLRAVQAACKSAKSYAELREKLKRVLRKSKSAKLAKLVERTLVMAHAAGRHAVSQEGADHAH